MNLNLFGKKDNKDSQDKMQTQEVKEAATTPSSEQEQPINPFVNPFNEKQNPPSNDMPPPIEDEPTHQTTEEHHEDLFAEQHPTEQTPPIMPQTPQTAPQPQQEMPPQPNPATEMDAHLESVQKEQPQNFDQIQEMIDETVEKIIDDKWDKVVSNVEKVLNWKEQLESQVNLVKEDIVSMKENFESLEKKITTKLSNYDRDILDVGSEIKALEKVFQKITPTLVNNVNELSKIARDLKGEDFEMSNSNDKKQL